VVYILKDLVDIFFCTWDGVDGDNFGKLVGIVGNSEFGIVVAGLGFGIAVVDSELGIAVGSLELGIVAGSSEFCSLGSEAFLPVSCSIVCNS